MKITQLNDDIPEWLKPHMKTMCKCWGVMIDDGPIGHDGVMKLTQRWCSNPQCPYHMAEKVQMLAKYFGVDGVGEATALDTILGYKLTNHLGVLKIWFAEKPEVYLYEVAELAYIYGVNSKWKDWLAGYRTFEEYYAKVNPVDMPEHLLMHKDYLMDCAQYFNIKNEVLNPNVMKIMITGSIRGYASRRDFLDTVNDVFKDVVRVEDNKKTIRDTFCLVKEPESVDYSKTQIALDHDIPIVTSEEFVLFLNSLRGGE